MTFQMMMQAAAVVGGSVLLGAVPIAGLIGWLSRSRRAVHVAVALVMVLVGGGFALALASRAGAFSDAAMTMGSSAEVMIAMEEGIIGLIAAGAAGIGLAWAAMALVVEQWGRR